MKHGFVDLNMFASQFQVSDEKKVLFVEQGEEGEEDAGEEHDPHYKPLLSELPPLVQVSTGEENEEVSQKLYDCCE